MEAEYPSPSTRGKPLGQPAMVSTGPSGDGPTAAGACPRCGGRGYVLESRGEHAHARVCTCRETCPRCRGRGYTLETRDNGYTYHVPCTCRKLKHRVDLFNRSLIPAHFTHKDLSTYEWTEKTRHARAVVENFVQSFPAVREGLLLVGPSGVGKTHLVTGIVKMLTLEKGVPCLFKDFFLLLSEVKASYEQGRFEASILRPLAEVEVLVIDELGKGRSNSDWEHSLLDEIVCKRYNQEKVTLLTTNFPLVPRHPRNGSAQRVSRGFRVGLGNLTNPDDLPTLEERIGDRIFSRLRQMCSILRIEAQDYRRTRSPGGSRTLPGR